MSASALIANQVTWGPLGSDGLMAFMDESAGRGEDTIWSVAVMIPLSRERSAVEGIDDLLRRCGAPDGVELKGARLFRGGGNLGVGAARRALLVAGLPEVLRSADARIVARGVEWREVRTWLRRRHDHGRSPYDIAFGHALQAVGRVAGERGIAIVHDETPRWKHLCSTAERARTRGVYSHCREPVAGLSSIAFDDSFASRLIQIADVYAWAFQRVWARTTGRRRGAQSAPHADPATEAARRFLLGAKDLVAERYVWRPRARRG